MVLYYKINSPKNVDGNAHKYYEDTSNANHSKHPVVEDSNIYKRRHKKKSKNNFNF